MSQIYVVLSLSFSPTSDVSQESERSQGSQGFTAAICALCKLFPFFSSAFQSPHKNTFLRGNSA